MIHTWASDITPLLQQDCYRQYYIRSPRFRQEKADSLKHALGKAQSIGVWALYMEMKAYFDLEGHEAHNFSHSGNYVLCSVCTTRKENVSHISVGCDVEQIRECRQELAKRFFCESEYLRIIKEARDRRNEIFTRYWVLKESFVKATGKGMSIPLNSFEIRIGEQTELIRKPEGYSEAFYYMESELGGGKYRVAVCSTDQEINANVKVIQLGL